MQSVTPFLATRDLAATIEFYTRLLEFKVDALHPPDKPTFVLLDNGGASVIFDSSLWRDPPNMTGQLHFDLGAEPADGSRVLSLFKRLASHVTILWGPEVYDYGRREFSCTDPNGYALVFSEQVRTSSA